jgi:hypothetical protein
MNNDFLLAFLISVAVGLATWYSMHQMIAISSDLNALVKTNRTFVLVYGLVFGACFAGIVYIVTNNQAFALLALTLPIPAALIVAALRAKHTATK